VRSQKSIGAAVEATLGNAPYSCYQPGSAGTSVSNHLLRPDE